MGFTAPPAIRAPWASSSTISFVSKKLYDTSSSKMLSDKQLYDISSSRPACALACPQGHRNADRASCQCLLPCLWREHVLPAQAAAAEPSGGLPTWRSTGLDRGKSLRGPSSFLSHSTHGRSVFYLPKPRPLSHLVGDLWRGPTLVLQGALDPLNDAKGATPLQLAPT